MCFFLACKTQLKVIPEEKTFGYDREKWKAANIVFFGDYVEAACHAYKKGLIQVRTQQGRVPCTIWVQQ